MRTIMLELKAKGVDDGHILYLDLDSRPTGISPKPMSLRH